MRYASIVFISFFVMSCSKEPQAIIYNQDNCYYCKMIISDQRYGAEIITTKGKNYKFGSAECMAATILSDQKDLEVYGIWVIDFNNPENFINAKNAWYLHSELLKSPMGMNFSAFSTLEMATTVKNVYPGSIIQWDELKDMVNNEWLAKKDD